MNPVVKHLIENKIVDMAIQAGMKDHGMLGGGWVSDDPEDKYPECVYTENLLKFAGLVSDFIVLRYPFQMNDRMRIMLDAAYESGFKHGHDFVRLTTEDIVGEARRCGAVFDIHGKWQTFESHEDLKQFFEAAYKIGLSVAHKKNESLLKEMLEDGRYSNNERSLLRLLHDHSTLGSYPIGIFRVKSKEDDDQGS